MHDLQTPLRRMEVFRGKALRWRNRSICRLDAADMNYIMRWLLQRIGRGWEVKLKTC